MNHMIFTGFGFILGFAICMGINAFTQNKADSPVLEDLPKTPVINPIVTPEPRFADNEEGTVIFKLTSMKDENFQSSEGSDATLYKLTDYCKIRIRVMGGSGFSNLNYFFSKDKLIYALQSNYYYPYGNLSNAEDLAHDSPELYTNQMFNPHSERVISEFESVLAEFPNEKVHLCFNAKN